MKLNFGILPNLQCVFGIMEDLLAVHCEIAFCIDCMFLNLCLEPVYEPGKTRPRTTTAVARRLLAHALNKPGKGSLGQMSLLLQDAKCCCHGTVSIWRRHAVGLVVCIDHTVTSPIHLVLHHCHAHLLQTTCGHRPLVTPVVPNWHCVLLHRAYCTG